MARKQEQITLKLNVTYAAFVPMVMGLKKVEYRAASKWMQNRLFYKNGLPKKIEKVMITAGYGKTRPSFICYFIKAEKAFSNNEHIHYPETDFTVHLDGEHYRIHLGQIMSVSNFHFPYKTSNATFKVIINVLSELGYSPLIKAVGNISHRKKRCKYQLDLNFEPIKVYSCRDYAKKYLIKLLNSKIENNDKSRKKNQNQGGSNRKRAQPKSKVHRVHASR